MKQPKQYLNTKEAAQLVGFSHRTLEGLRYRGAGPRFCKLSNTRIRYRIEDLIEWIEGAQTTEPA